MSSPIETKPKPMKQDQSMSNQHTMEDKPKGRTGLVIAIIVVLIVGIAAAGGAWYWQNQKIKQQQTSYEQQITGLNQKLADLNKQLTDLKLIEQSVANAADKKMITDQVKAMYKYWIDNKDKDYNYLLKNNYITQAVVDQSKSGLSYDLISCSQNTLEKSTDYDYAQPAVASDGNATMKVTGVYPGDGTSKQTLVIGLDLTKQNSIWKVSKITCPNQ